ncbi:hypothetical protein ACTJJ0_20690 [Chitinophaga sp. 22321]|uniref:Uncharacterized protein n=1 Tax=Chitinophaga hostae TaxID=2831022 RepID=A0ABS5J3U8_9BACT|nr:hypothetical protein [Chitinophaga hostae]MBS0029903.1 hypothetical protein [Chitinophaga hostae]
MKPRCFFQNLLLFLAVSVGVAVLPASGQVAFKTRQWSLQLDNSGKLTSMKSLALQKEFLFAGKATSLMSIKKDGNILPSQACEWNPKKSELALSYPAGVEAKIKVQRNDSYISFELVSLTPSQNIDLVLWGPYPTTIADTVGETVGVVRNREFAIGIQALNIKTLGGYPNSEADNEPSYDVFDGGNKVDVKEDDLKKQLFRGDVARPTDFGAVLQAYCRNRDKDRVVENWGYSAYLAPAFKDGGVIGSKIALFGVTNGDILPTISQIEVKEGLPHPLLDGEWGKQALHASESYLIMDFGVDNLQEAIAVTKQAGLRYLYHGDPFDTWGHFKLHAKEFPQNWASMKACVEAAKAKGVRLGVHTLSNFITTNDPYVTPVPDTRLGKAGYSKLSAAIDANAKEVGIEDPLFFNQFQNNTLKAITIGNEIIRYGSVSAAAPWKLLDCQRGAFGTTAASHQQNDTVNKLADHAYKVFLTDYALQEEMSTTIANLFNETGLMQISFDGLEGCLSSGMGQYAKQLFTKNWYDHLKPELRGKVINDASTPGHYFWHIYTRMNWGEPWYAGFRESQLQLRLKNQQFFRRNLMPSMLGWFSLRPETTPEDIEWMLAMGAGYNAGFGLATSLETLKKHGMKDEVLGLIKTWEQARMKNIFNEARKEQMRSLKHEFHLEMTGNNEYRLTPVYNAYFKHTQQMKQPGEPVFSTFQFNNPAASQPIAFIISLAGGKDKDYDPDVTFDQVSITINHQDALVLPVSLKRNQFLKCDGKTIRLYNKQWQLVQTVELSKPLPVLSADKNEIVFDGKYSGENGADVKLEIRASGQPELIRANH